MTAPHLLARRVLALSLLAALLGTGYLLLIAPVAAERALNAESIADDRDLLERLDRLAAMRSGLAARLDAVRRQQAAQAFYLTEATDALAAAELQERVRAVIAGGGVTLRSIQILPAQDEEGFRRIAIRVQVSTALEGLFEIAYALETTKPLLFIDNVDVQSRMVRQTTTGPAPDPMLAVTLDLYGYRPAEGS